jgi:hypothetical protein
MILSPVFLLLLTNIIISPMVRPATLPVKSTPELLAMAFVGAPLIVRDQTTFCRQSNHVIVLH